MLINIIKITILSLVEGLTEFIPVSSTGHMIIIDNFLKLSNNKNFVNAFQIIIQFGAILSVIVYYWDKIFPFSKKNSKDKNKDILKMWLKIIVAMLPSAILGILFDDIIEKYFFNIFTVTIMLIFYGFLLIWIENRNNKHQNIHNINNLPWSLALGIGLFQALAMIPGTSRSAATILGGMLLGLNRILATEFSFFLAIPTMLGASLLKILKLGNTLTYAQWLYILLGFILSFIFAYIVIKKFIGYIKNNNFKIFGYYRIILGLFIIVLYLTGVIK